MQKSFSEKTLRLDLQGSRKEFSNISGKSTCLWQFMAERSRKSMCLWQLMEEKSKKTLLMCKMPEISNLTLRGQVMHQKFSMLRLHSLTIY